MSDESENLDLEITSKVNKIDLEILNLLQKRLSLLAKKETPAPSLKKEKRGKNTKSNNPNDSYQLELIHKGRKLGIRRSLIRKIFRSLEQESIFLQKKTFLEKNQTSEET